MHLGVVSDVDGLAMTMLAVLILSFGVVALLLWSIFRHGKRRDHEPEKVPAPSTTPEAREPWEKDGDWWKK